MSYPTTFNFLKKTHLIIVLIASIFASCSKEPIAEGVSLTTISSYNISDIEQELFALVNHYRNSLGKNSLEFSDVAYEYANEHTEYMIAKGAMSHDNFSSRASKIANEVGAIHIEENVAKEYSNASEALKNWLASPSHKKTIEGEFSYTGISIEEDANGNLYYTQIFYN